MTVISKSPLFIDSSIAGNVFLKTVQKFTVTDDSDLELVYGSGSDEAIGEIEKPGGGSIDLDVRRVAAPEVDWKRLQALKHRFVLTAVDNPGGARVEYSGCRVANVSDDSDDQGEHTSKIKILWARRAVS